MGNRGGKNVGEIKSTLDLIMEKTRNMSLSEEEKEELKTRELVARLRGLIQKGLEGFLSVSQLRAEIETERIKSPATDHHLMAALAARIEPDGENERLFQIMEEVSGRDSAPFKEVVLEWRQDMGRLKDRSVEVLSKALKKRGVTGSAVLPNPALDPAWQSAYEERKTACRRRLDAIADTRTTPARSSENLP
jgi:hypothetical protein